MNASALVGGTASVCKAVARYRALFTASMKLQVHMKPPSIHSSSLSPRAKYARTRCTCLQSHLLKRERQDLQRLICRNVSDVS